jgi:hypothetical protein
MREINLKNKISEHLVLGTDKRWLAGPEREPLEKFLDRYPGAKEEPLYKDLWQKDLLIPERGAKGGGLFPVLRLLQDGRLACVMRTGMSHVGPGEISISYSSDKGRTWSPYEILVKSDGFFDKRDPSLGQTASGDLLLVYGVYDAYRDGGTRNLDENGNEPGAEDPVTYRPMEMIRSTDNGHSWREPQALEYDLGGVYLKPHGQMHCLRDGSMAFNARGYYPYKMYDANPDLPERVSFIFRSFDEGRTWTQQSDILFDCTESGFIQLKEDHLLGYCRYNQKPAVIAHSYDLGQSWDDAEAPFPDDDYKKRVTRRPGQPVLLPKGKVVIVYGYRSYPFGVRAIASHDKGKSFDNSREYILTDSYFLSDCGYPSTVVFDDGTIVTVAYTIACKSHMEWNTCCIAYVYDQSIFDI